MQNQAQLAVAQTVKTYRGVRFACVFDPDPLSNDGTVAPPPLVAQVPFYPGGVSVEAQNVDVRAYPGIDDGNSAFNYAVVGHDVDRGGIDGDAQSTCCQCYQLVYAYPSPYNDRQALTNPDNPDPPVSAIQIPKPLIVQSFNTAATPYTFDVYMAAGGLGANNACAPGLQPAARSGQYLYTSYPADGQPSQGGVKPASLYPECKTPTQWVTAESLASTACQDRIAAACQQITSDVPGLTEQARRSCLASTAPDSQYLRISAIVSSHVGAS